ncbi:MAG: hypothetical protein R6U52_01430 [Kosmotogaceae bacterium]
MTAKAKHRKSSKEGKASDKKLTKITAKDLKPYEPKDYPKDHISFDPEDLDNEKLQEALSDELLSDKASLPLTKQEFKTLYMGYAHPDKGCLIIQIVLSSLALFFMLSCLITGLLMLFEGIYVGASIYIIISSTSGIVSLLLGDYYNPKNMVDDYTASITLSPKLEKLKYETKLSIKKFHRSGD